jgi:hypothetical protein
VILIGQEVLKLKENEKICPQCGQIHDLEEDDLNQVAEDFTESVFEKIWSENKEELRDMSKKELAEQMYFLGVLHYMKSLEAITGHMLEDIFKDIK